jgi:hypothetical protein
MKLLSAYGVGSALGRGPVVLYLPPRLLDIIGDKAAREQPGFLQLQASGHVDGAYGRSCLPACPAGPPGPPWAGVCCAS